jgi:hypothetical protein
MFWHLEYEQYGLLSCNNFAPVSATLFIGFYFDNEDGDNISFKTSDFLLTTLCYVPQDCTHHELVMTFRTPRYR